ncbi:bifunctional diaminohydroxyphosphoribosylaminopyrimidine deaminase/5-amino-6-(5-phosphoribosylamino)uracil reductase RibD [Collimonas sp.]|jgi:diaminohydroxyphosphoribosylaminopyrimidine deaminase/5-amino-6-(5-phosphoribosylamino)uracil reductase|uniref:bifunctional diaminohydroxyphosphoribosylaminopyrimidine deaminase/5-amino-6-(5-phosphoribosylamino)uracil reductase RibD n=1 Tax=Collimonas sp. TaxID=1963772 RepID=UPI002BA61457|nr:bifunctional diaminohydroxyphosphoribosylaminopyrimidine deaminase/5-amino-6-(5-phosphoribosylamino)uracil reductase RibD [Collimonas sp.]HWW04040.1 bifunctional diaminohydroxyphosphoribosylaminopyrimidine deaminase/5-amino-6-(5-phosphoribosylamino)uracil reductase RibD [Collimonas sp.]
MTPAELLMSQALQLAENGRLSSAPNPAIGCVIVKDGQIIGSGFTQPPGGNHAEIQALQDAAAKGHDVRGATVYVTLEPCSHFGRTPPCADALVRAGVAKVVAAMADPNPLVAGQGMARLQAAGIAVESGILAAQARELNIGFFTRMLSGKPWVRLKVAASLDGKTALHNGQSQWITSQAARDDGHMWRARAGAILTGIGTVKEDNPQLTVRTVQLARQPLRVIVDSKLSISPDAKILVGGGNLIFSATVDAEKQALLEQQGAEVVVLPNASGKVDLPQVILELGKRQINELHVEAGSKLNASLIREHCVDELLVYLAPVILGDGRGMFDLPALENLQDKLSLKFHQIKQIGEDLRILARFL